ncbi:tafazzin family protein [Caerostris extrusa]|nr:tafazzin family protein [Caerostris extrusa]
MDSVLPNVEPYRPKFGQKVTVFFGDPIDFTSLREKLKNEYQSAMEKRKIITDKIQDNLFHLKQQAESLHLANSE